jgi:hypothetical protein
VTGPDDVRAAAGYPPPHPALRIRCRRCGAQPGRPCTTPSGRHPLREPHPSRTAAVSNPSEENQA